MSEWEPAGYDVIVQPAYSVIDGVHTYMPYLWDVTAKCRECGKAVTSRYPRDSFTPAGIVKRWNCGADSHQKTHDPIRAYDITPEYTLDVICPVCDSCDVVTDGDSIWCEDCYTAWDMDGETAHIGEPND